MINLLILDVRANKTVPDKYLPTPAMGNMRQDNPEYQAKYAEKLARLREEAVSDPVLAEPCSAMALYCQVKPASDSSHKSALIEVQPPRLANIILEGADRLLVFEQFSALVSPTGPEPFVISGTHPHTHLRMLINSCLRRGASIPLCLRTTSRVYNPWRELGVTQEYPASAELLGQRMDNPVMATFDLLFKTGVPFDA